MAVRDTPKDGPSGGPACLDLPAPDRALLMDWLAGLLARVPTAQTIAVLAGEDGARALAALSMKPVLAGAAEDLFQATRAVRAAAGSDAAAAGVLEQAFGTLFEASSDSGGDRPDGACISRLASTYRDGADETEAMSPQDRISVFLAAHDLERAEDSFEPPDHISVMLAALSALAAREAQARALPDPDLAAQAQALSHALARVQADFAAKELAPWLPAFRARVAAADRHGFHAAVARLAECAVMSDPG